MRALLPLLLLFSTGCFHLAGQVTETRKAVSSLESTHDRLVPLPKRTTVHLDTSVKDGDIFVKATRVKWCRSERIEVYRNLDRVTRKLPTSHWVVLASGLIMGGAGAASWAVGDALLPTAYTFTIDEPQLESKRDLGHVLVPVGAALTSLAAIFLTSYAIDASKLKTELRPLAKTERVVNLGSGPCNRAPARNLRITFHQPGSGGSGPAVASTLTGDDGQGSVSIFATNLGTLPFTAPFVMLACKQCKRAKITLPPDLSARLVMKHRKEEQLAQWLEVYPNHFMAKDVQHMLKQIIEKRRSAALITPQKRLIKAHKHLADHEKGAAMKELHTCLADTPQHRGCQHLLSSITRARTGKMAGRAHYALKWRQPIRAFMIAEECLYLDPNQKSCAAVKRAVSKRWLRTNLNAFYKLQNIRKRANITSIDGFLRAPRNYSQVHLQIRLHRGRKILCSDKQTLTKVRRGRSIAFSGMCENIKGTPDRVSLTIAGYLQ
jgi:hypothetical protein